MTVDASDGSVVIGEAWRRFREDADPAARELLIVHYSPLVKFVASRLAAGLPASVDTGDLISAGVFGLMDALDRFDAERGAKFETFAIPRIRGAVLDGLRQLDWVPRSVRRHARAVESAIAELEAALHRTPTDEELAAELEISPGELQRWLNGIAVANVGPLEHLMATGRGDVTNAGAEGVPGAEFEDRELRHAMRAEVRRLPERERTVIALYYSEGLTLAEIGAVLGVTESRVSQIHTKAVLVLRSRLNAAGH